MYSCDLFVPYHIEYLYFDLDCPINCRYGMGQSASMEVAPGGSTPTTSTTGSIGRSFGSLANEFDFIHHQIRRHSLTLRQLTMLTYDDLQSKINELNNLSSKFVDCNGKQLTFELKDGGGEAPVMLWKGLIRIRCMKINPETKHVEKVRDLNLKQFLQVYNTMSQMHGTLVLDSVDSEEEDEDHQQSNDKKEVLDEEQWDHLHEASAPSSAANSTKNTPRKRPIFNMSTSLILDELHGGALNSPSSLEECCVCMENKHEA